MLAFYCRLVNRVKKEFIFICYRYLVVYVICQDCDVVHYMPREYYTTCLENISLKFILSLFYFILSLLYSKIMYLEVC